MPVTITDKMTVDSVVALFKSTNVCNEGVAWAESFTGKTWGEVADKAVLNVENVNQTMFWGFLRKYGAEIDPDLRKKFLKGIRNDMMIFRMYLDCDWLTSEEDAILESGFKGLLPVAEEELRTGIIKRVKV